MEKVTKITYELGVIEHEYNKKRQGDITLDDLHNYFSKVEESHSVLYIISISLTENEVTYEFFEETDKPNKFINSAKDIAEFTEFIPTAAINDVEKRITDWRSLNGGCEFSPYIFRQFEYLERFIPAGVKEEIWDKSH